VVNLIIALVINVKGGRNATKRAAQKLFSYLERSGCVDMGIHSLVVPMATMVTAP